MNMSVAIIGSFRKHYDIILAARLAMQKQGIIVTSPLGGTITTPEKLFVRLSVDSNEESDEMIQSITLKRILNADFVYVVSPDGYIGRTTCYEVGRCLQAKKPIYFSESPKDIPIWIPTSHIKSVENISRLYESKIFNPVFMYRNTDSDIETIERELIYGNINNS